MKKLFFIAVIVFSSFNLFSQEDSKKEEYDPKKEVVFDGKRYRVWNNYLTVGGLTGVNSTIPTSQFVGALDFNFHIQKEYFQVGAFLSGNTFYDKNNTNLHAGWGKRIERNRYNFAAFGGVCYSLFYPYDRDSMAFYAGAETEVGAYVCVQNVYKFKYDLGIGVTLFGEYNKQRYIYGVRIELYFSSAFRGDKGRRKNQ